MWLLTLNILWALPVIVFYWARRHAPVRVWQFTGVSFGLVVVPAAFALYFLYHFHPVTAPFGILGLVVLSFHVAPGYHRRFSSGSWSLPR